MARNSVLLLALGLYITLALSSSTVWNSTDSEPHKPQCREGYNSCMAGAARCHECLDLANSEVMVECDGYEGAEKTCCCDIDECQKRQLCGKHAKCSNTFGSYHCSCIEGFKSSSGQEVFKNASETTCDDLNECLGPNKCGSHSVCDNTPGSYTCRCRAGFQEDFRNASLVTCTDIDECQQNASICEPNGSCINSIGDYLCKCKPGFGKSSKNDRKICKDIDECVSNPCGEGAKCQNHPGKFWCPCLPGYINYTEVTPEGKTKSSCKLFSCSAYSSKSCSNEQTFICSFTAQLNSICNSSLRAQDHRDKEKLLKDMLNLLDDRVSSLAPLNESEEERHRRATELMSEVESWLRHFAVTLSNMVISIDSSKGTELDMEIRTAKSYSQHSALLSQNGTQMELSWDVANREDQAAGVIGLLSYQGLGPLLAGARMEQEADRPIRVEILSKVAAAFVGHENTTSLNIPVNFTFDHTEEVHPLSFSSGKKLEQRLVCAFWKPDGGWSAKGCNLLESHNSSTRCQCSHLTSFAVLMAFYEVEDWGLDVITRIGLILSLIFLFLSILTFLFCRSIRGIRTTIHLHLCLALFAAHTIFLVGAENTANKTACAIVAGLLHYFFLSAFCWMLLEGVELYLMVVQVFRTHSLKSWQHMLVGYGLPAILVGITAAINHRGYGTKRHCWLSMEHGFHWSFLAPVCLIILINAVVFVVTIWKLTKKFADINPNMSQLKKQKVLVITAIAQLCILGTTWIFGMFQFSDHSLVMSYIFTILNSFQGFFIFVLHCLFKKQVREDYCQLLCRHKSGRPRSSDKYTEFNSTGTLNTLRPQKSSQESGI